MVETCTRVILTRARQQIEVREIIVDGLFCTKFIIEKAVDRNSNHRIPCLQVFAQIGRIYHNSLRQMA